MSRRDQGARLNTTERASKIFGDRPAGTPAELLGSVGQPDEGVGVEQDQSRSTFQGTIEKLTSSSAEILNLTLPRRSRGDRVGSTRTTGPALGDAQSESGGGVPSKRPPTVDNRTPVTPPNADIRTTHEVSSAVNARTTRAATGTTTNLRPTTQISPRPETLDLAIGRSPRASEAR
jgi:hypothetical protein